MNRLLAMAFMLSGFLLTSSCGDDGVDPAGDVTFSGVTPNQEIENEGTYGPVDITLEAEDGLASLVVTKDGANFFEETYSGETSATYLFSYTAVTEDADSNIAFVFTATDEDGDTESATLVLSVGEAPEVPTTVTISSNISEDATWTTGTTYILGGRITVLDGVTLTIEPGVVVKGESGAEANATALIVARGAKLMAEGTAEMPIIFTSVADEITPADVAAGNFGSPNLTPDINGDWGGLIILGKARISASNDNDEDVSEVQIEGIPTSDTNGLYGGTEDDDNSGVIRYVSIRHGGTNIGAGNEINGLSLGGVGTGTTIEHIEIVSNQDDGIEWFGGAVDVSNVVVWNTGDDAIDTDQAWSGTLDNFILVSPGGSCFELDGPEGTYTARHTIQNGTIKASSDYYTAGALIDVDPASIVRLESLFFTGLVDGQLIGLIDGGTVGATCDNNGCPFAEVQLELPEDFDLESFIQGGEVPAGVSVVTTATVGADASVFAWTWASQAGALEDL